MKYKLFPFIMTSFVFILIISNTVAVKIIHLGIFTFDGATLLFPLSYVFGDILTEVYGYKKSRIVIWVGFIGCIFMSLIYWLIGILPSDVSWNNQDAYQLILGQTPRIVIASILAYFCGEFINSYVLAKMKIYTKGKWLWSRLIGSTIVGEAIDSFMFVIIAFYGTIPFLVLMHMIISNYLFKVLFEVCLLPITYKIISKIKYIEKEDFYDYNTNFNPLILK